MSAWTTNDPTAAKALQAADSTYERAKAAASGLALSDKLTALRNAKAARQAAYDAVVSAARKAGRQ